MLGHCQTTPFFTAVRFKPIGEITLERREGALHHGVAAAVGEEAYDADDAPRIQDRLIVLPQLPRENAVGSPPPKLNSDALHQGRAGSDG